MSRNLFTIMGARKLEVRAPALARDILPHFYVTGTGEKIPNPPPNPL